MYSIFTALNASAALGLAMAGINGKLRRGSIELDLRESGAANDPMCAVVSVLMAMVIGKLQKVKRKNR
jgi:hypothetical protein